MELRFTTAGESHGPGLVAVVEGLPAGLELTPEDLDRDLARRQLGHGRGGRMKIESDRAEVTAGIRHLRTRPYRPQTNGKAERLIRTLLGGWAYGAIYRSSSERTAALDGWLWRYNHLRRHSALGHKPPVARLAERTNLLGSYT